MEVALPVFDLALPPLHVSQFVSLALVIIMPICCEYIPKREGKKELRKG